MFESFVNWASKQSGFSDAWSGGNWKDRVPDFKFIPSDMPVWRGSSEIDKLGGGKWRDRFPDLSGTPNLGSPNYPEMGDKGALSWLSDKTTEGLTALSSPGSGLHRLGTNVEAVWKGIYEGVEYPERTWNQWRKLDLANTGAPSSDDTSTASSPSSSSTVTTTTTGGGSGTAEEERARLDAIRRMLAGRYGRAETNLTGGSGYGTGQARGLGGTV